MDIKQIIQIQEKHQHDLMKKANVVTVGVGYKYRNGQKTSIIGIVVGVAKKLPIAVMRAQDVLPKTVDGVEIDVQETGLIRAEPRKMADAIAQGEFNTVGRYRPPMPGISIGHKCYDPKTNVLTRRGLVPIAEVTLDDHVATLSREGEFEWQNPTNTFEYDYIGDMYLIENRTLNLMITPNHNLFVRNRNKKGAFALIEAEKAFSEIPFNALQFKRNCEWHCVDMLVKQIEPKCKYADEFCRMNKHTGTIVSFSKKYGVPYRTAWRWKHGLVKPPAFNSPLKFDIDNWVQFLGWYISEGSCDNNGIRISEKSGRYHAEIIAMLRRMGFSPCVNKDNSIGIVNASLSEYLHQFGLAHEKFIPDEIKALPPNRLKILLKALVSGDGHWGKNGHPRSYKTVSRKLAHDVFEVGLKCGYGVTIQEYAPNTGGTVNGGIIAGKKQAYRVGFSFSKLTPRLGNQPIKIPYDGKIYCIEVPNHVLFVEREGKTCWCGNSVTAGTFGCVVTKDGIDYILSNCHVMANSNDAVVGDPIYQPGPYDGGGPNDTIAQLSEFVPIAYQGEGGGGGEEPPTCFFAKSLVKVLNKLSEVFGRTHRFTTFDSAISANYVDAALAVPTVPISREIVEIGTPQGIETAYLGMPIQKFGRTTFHTTGTIEQINVMSSVSYGGAKVAIFYGQLLAGAMSAGGDSGSAVLSMNQKVVGLLFAGSDTTTLINPIDKVIEALGVAVP